MALRLACFLCLLTFFVAATAGPAGAYSCSSGSGRTLSAHSNEADRECSRLRKGPLERKADPISFAFFVGLIVVVLLVPVVLGKREDLPPQ